MREILTSKDCIVDNTNCKLPVGNILYKVYSTYGKDRYCYDYVSATNIKNAKEVFYKRYEKSFFKILDIKIESEDHNKWYNRKNTSILGKMDIKTIFYRQYCTEIREMGGNF